MDEKQKLFRVIRLILQFGCLTYLALFVAILIVLALGG